MAQEPSSASPDTDPETRRLERLVRLGIMDSEGTEPFESLLRDMATQLGVPIAALGLIDAQRHWLKAIVGLEGIREVPCDQSVPARRTIRQHGICQIEDLSQDAEFRDLPYVIGAPHLRFYAGTPLRLPGGECVGSLCVYDWRPRRLDDAQLRMLALMGRVCVELMLERERAQDALRGTLQPQIERDAMRLRQAVEASQLAFWELDCLNWQLRISASWHELTGRSPQEADGIDLRDMEAAVHPDDREALGRTIRALLKSEEDHADFEHRIFRPDGRTVWVHCLGRITERDAQGRAVRATGTLFDISARKEAEEAAARSTTITRATLESSADAFLVVDRKGQVLFYNQEFLRFWHLTDQDMARGPAFALAKASGRLIDRGALATMIERASHSREPATQHRLETLDGRCIEVASRPVFIGKGVIGRVWTHRDITAHRAAQLATERAREAAEAASRAKTDFLTTVSHEIRTPLNGVIGLTGLLLDERLTPGQRQYAELIQSSAQSLLGLINDLLDLGTIESGHLHLEHAPFDLRALVHECGALFVPRAREKHLLFRVELDEALPQWVSGDALRLRQVLSNLLSNAIKYTHAGQVWLRVRPTRFLDHASELEFDIQDTGVGIPLEVQPTLFQRFARGDAHRAAAYRGTGLGLAIVKQLCDLMDGEVRLHSAPGEGTRLTVRLPLALAEPPQGVAAASEGTDVTPQLARLLLAEDNATNQVVLAGLLKQLGYQNTRLAANGQEALDLAMREPFDAVLMDCNMPVVDGYDAAQRLRAQGLALPIIAMTANATDADRRRCVEAGMNDFLPKPLDRGQLQACLDRWLSRAPAPTQRISALPPQPPTPPQVFEREAVRERLGLDDELIRLILSSYVEEFPAVLQTLQSALEARDIEVLRHTLHTLAGSSVTVGAGVLAEEARRLEVAVMQGELDEVRDGLRFLETQLAEFMLAALG